MKKRFREKHPYIASISVAILCTFMTGLGMAISQIIGLTDEKQFVVIAFILTLSSLIGFIIIKVSKLSIAQCGLQASAKNTHRKVWYYIPLILIEILPILIGGFAPNITMMQYLTLLLFVIAVGFHEEIYFRGIAYQFLLGKGRKTAIIASSIIFGVLHLANAFGGKNPVYLVLQMFFAFLVGIVLSQLVSITNSLWILIIWHATHDYIASITNDSLDMKALIILALQVFILLIYSIGLWKAGIENFKSNSSEALT